MRFPHFYWKIRYEYTLKYQWFRDENTRKLKFRCHVDQSDLFVDLFKDIVIGMHSLVDGVKNLIMWLYPNSRAIRKNKTIMQLENDSGFLQQAGCERILGNVFMPMNNNNSKLLHQLYRSHIWLLICRSSENVAPLCLWAAHLPKSVLDLLFH